MTRPSTENEKLIFSKLIFIRDEYSKIEFNYKFLIQEAIKFKNIYDNLVKKSTNNNNNNTPINNEYLIKCQEILKWTNNFKEFIEVKLYTFELQFQYFMKIIEELKDDYKKLDDFNLKDNYYVFVLNYIEKIQEIIKNYYDKIKEINLPVEYIIVINHQFNRNILPHKHIDDYFLNNIKKLERLELIKISYRQKYFDLLFNEYSIEKEEEYQIKKHQFISDVNKILQNLDIFYDLLKNNYIKGVFKTKLNDYTNSYPIFFIIQKNIKLIKDFTEFL